MMNNSDAGEVLDVFCYLLCLGCKAGGPVASSPSAYPNS